MNCGNNFFIKTYRNNCSGVDKNNLGKKEYKNEKFISPSKENFPLYNRLNINRELKPEKKYINQRKNIKEIKVKFCTEEKKKNIISRFYYKNDIYMKIIYIQRWWKIWNKKILMKREENILFLIKKICRLFFNKLVVKVREKIEYSEKNRGYLNEMDKNLKNKIINKIKKYETSTSFNKKMKFINNSLLNVSKTNSNLLIKKLETHEKTRNENMKNFCSSKGPSSFSSINIKKLNNIPLNKINIQILKNNKEKKSYKNKIFNEEKLNAYKNISNIYNNVKKIYENSNKNNLYEANSTYQDFHKKNSLYNKESKKLKFIKKVNKNIKINNNKDISLNININDIKNKEKKINNMNNKESSYIINFNNLSKSFKIWKEFSTKKNIIKKLKMLREKKEIFKNKINDEEKKREHLTITTKKINLSNSIIKQKLCLISPRELNPKKYNNINNKQSIYNYASKINNYKNDIKNNKKIKKENEAKNFPNTEKSFNKYFCEINHYNEDLKIVEKKKNKWIYKPRNEEKIYYFYNIIKLIERRTKINKIKKYYNRWKMLIKFNKNNCKEIEEKTINFKKNKQIFLNPNNSQSDIFYKRNTLINLFNNSFSQTESNIDFPFIHFRTNSSFIPNGILTPSNYSKEKLIKDYINMNSHKIIYRKKLLIEERKGKNFKNMNEERNLTELNSSGIDTLKLTGEKFYKSIYGGKFFENKYSILSKGNKKIEEREICFTPNKKNTFNNNFKIDVNIVENYLNKVNEKDKEENYNCNNIGIKTKQIIFKNHKNINL